MALRDQVLDDALAGAKAHSHPAVEPRHVLWAIVHVLGSNAPDDLKTANVRRFLDPAGTAIESPAVSPEATTVLAAITDDDTAISQARAILASLDARAGAAPAPTTRRRGGRWGGDLGRIGHQRAIDGPPAHRPRSRRRRARSPVAILAELDALIGMPSVKAEVRRLVAVERLNAARRAAGLPEIEATNHLVFTGPPAPARRRRADHRPAVRQPRRRHQGPPRRGDARGPRRGLRRPDGAQGHGCRRPRRRRRAVHRRGIRPLERRPRDSAARRSRPRQADGGPPRQPGRDRRRLSRPDRDFIDTNPGLRSRFTRYIDFPDFTSDEMTEIFVLMAAAAKVQARRRRRCALRQVAGQGARGAGTSATPASCGRCSSAPTRTWRTG